MSYRCGLIIGCVALAVMAPWTVKAATTTKQEKVGPFTIIYEHWLRDGPPVMHMESETKVVRLRWESHDGQLKVDILDDGFMLKSEVNLGRCFATYAPLGSLSSLPSNNRHWRWEIDYLRQVSRECDRSDASVIAAYQLEMREALSHYPAAADRWKERSRKIFPGGRRCKATKRVEAVIPFERCVKYYESK